MSYNRQGGGNRGGGNRGGSGGRSGGRPGGGYRRRNMRPRVIRRKKCAKVLPFNYKNPETLTQYITSHGRIKPVRLNGLCTKQQRLLAREIKELAIWLCCHLSVINVTGA